MFIITIIFVSIVEVRKLGDEICVYGGVEVWGVVVIMRNKTKAIMSSNTKHKDACRTSEPQGL